MSGTVSTGTRCRTVLDAAGDVRAARRLALATVEGWGLARLVGDVEVVVAELVTNAVVHGRPPVTLTLMRRGFTVVVRVADSGPMRPPHAHSDESGRGLHVVAALATTFAVIYSDDGTGKTVVVTFGTRAQKSGAAA